MFNPFVVVRPNGEIPASSFGRLSGSIPDITQNTQNAMTVKCPCEAFELLNFSE